MLFNIGINHFDFHFIHLQTTPPGTIVFRDIIVTDSDIGANAEMKLSCQNEVVSN